MRLASICFLCLLLCSLTFGQSRAVSTSVTIDDSATTSSSIKVKRNTLTHLIIPAGFEGTAITFEVSVDGETTWVPLYASDGTQVSATVAASQAIHLPPATFIGAAFSLRLVAGTAQTGAAVIGLITRGL